MLSFSRVGGEQKIRLGLIKKLPAFFIPGILGSGDEYRFLTWDIFHKLSKEERKFLFLMIIAY